MCAMLSALYSGCFRQLSHNPPHHFTDLSSAGWATRICSGITTGVLAVSLGQPTDVVKVRMQAQGASGIIRYSSAFNAYRTINAEEGVRGLWKGMNKWSSTFKLLCFKLHSAL